MKPPYPGGAGMTAAVDLAPKPCLHPVATHHHGERECYLADRCRCAPCRAANAQIGRFAQAVIA